MDAFDRRMDALIVGLDYFVRIEDCCISGEFTSRLLEKRKYTEAQPDGTTKTWIEKLVWANGVILEETFHGCKFFLDGKEVTAGESVAVCDLSDV